jgi:site-specific DNA-methyltransferase (adenine-specific)
MLNKALYASNTEEWATPQAFFDELDKEFNFTLDPCATQDNAKCRKFFTKEQDGLRQSWNCETVFCNPPYGKEITKWVAKADEEAQQGATVVMLIPARTDTRYFHEHIYNKYETRFIRGRLHFNESKNAAPFPSMVVVMKGKKQCKL